MTADLPAPPASALPLVGGLVLLVGTGFVDAYTFLAHGHVFAEAMTGNIVLAGIGVVDPAVVPFWRPLLSFAAFVVGVTAAWLLTRTSASRAPQVATLAALVVVLTVAGFLPASVPDTAVAGPISFAAGLQIASFDQIGRARLTTIVMTSNSRVAVQATLQALSSRTSPDVRAAGRLLAALAAFVVGVAVGALVTEAVGGRAAWAAAGLFVVAGVVYVTRPVPGNPVQTVR